MVSLATGCGRSVPVADVGPSVVDTAAGPVRGIIEPGLRIFAGVPYAAAPEGALRWKPPVAPVPWDSVRDATKPGLRCIQDTRVDPDYGLATSEDCLNLTVWTPGGAAPNSPRPVMVWFHGGGFLNGSSDIYNARWLATRGDIVVVAVNYRLGALGFLAHPALGTDGDQGNYGLADQQAALRWVRDNIIGFGGDPAKITIAGESAGAISVRLRPFFLRPKRSVLITRPGRDATTPPRPGNVCLRFPLTVFKTDRRTSRSAPTF